MKSVSGITTEDPLGNPKPSDEVSFEFARFTSPIDDGFTILQEWEGYGGALFGLTIKTDIHRILEGSAVSVAPGIAICARHVIQDHLDEAIAGKKSIMLHSITDDGLQIYAIRKVTLNHNSDVCILEVALASKMPPSNTLISASLTTQIPKLGEKLFCTGMREDRNLSTPKSINVVVCVAVGCVTDIFLNGRDAVMLPNPCIEVAMPSIGGMSGGPVFDERGFVVGILSSSFDGATGPSYVSLIHPMLTQEISTCWPPGIIEPPYNLVEYGKIIPFLDGAEAFSKNSEGEWQYDLWHEYVVK
jgi:Trypsin-like peptidase domain